MKQPVHHVTQTTPLWISDELVRETLIVWQPYYLRPLTEHEAVEILLGVGTLFDVLGASDDEAVSSVGKSIEPRTRA